jgi:hypothetical protein
VSDDLRDLQDALLRGLRLPVPPTPDEAFERHQLLVIRFHRAARLNDRAGDKEWQSWCRYFAEHFPRGDTHAELLWHQWRVPLVKDETPGEGVAITHGQAHAHWRVYPQQGLCINIESMWDDYEESVNRFIASLAANKERRAVALDRWRQRQWTVQTLSLEPAAVLASTGTSVTTASAIAPPTPTSPGRQLS